LFDLLTAVAAIAFLLLVAAGVAALITWVSPAFRRPARLITDRWQATTDGIRAPAPTLAMEIALPGTTYTRQPGDRSPWVRFVVTSPAARSAMILTGPPTRAAFGAFLQRPAVAELLADLTYPGQDAAWARQATSTSSIIDMVLGDGVASARLELPDGIRRHGRVEGYALLVVHVEPRDADGTPAPPASPSSWRRQFERALQLPGAFAALLSGELGLTVSGEPPAQAGIRLEAHLRVALAPGIHVAEQPVRAARRVRPQPVADIHAQPDPPIGPARQRQPGQRPAQPGDLDPPPSQDRSLFSATEAL